VLAVCGFLLLAVGLVFAQTVRCQFLNFDDDKYVYENAQVSGGLAAAGIAWAFTHSHAANWHPLTWISLMLDCQVYGINAGGCHLTNVLLHAATAVLLFLVLWRMSGGFWPSAVVAAVFAVHPLRVESVAWVAERKDVLSGLFFVLTLGAYVSYARRPFSVARYLLIMVFLALGLMAKPILVTLPLVLLLLDYWPLGRMDSAADADNPALGRGRLRRLPLPARLALEKVPLLVLAAVSCAVTVWAQAEALVPIEYFPLWWRMENALVCYVAYLGQLFYPVGLVIVYPRPGLNLPHWWSLGAFLVLGGITAAVLLWRRTCPYLLVGWLWYLGMLVPVIGLIQIGTQAIADRYTYLPQIGLGIALAWAVADGCRSSRRRRWVCGVASMLLLAVLMGWAWRQASFWRDSETLWTRALACTSRNSIARNGLGATLLAQRRFDEAIPQFQQSVDITPDYFAAYANLGTALQSRGRINEAITQYRKALELKPNDANLHSSLATALARHGQVDEAIAQYQRALEIKPDYVETHGLLGDLFASRGNWDEAARHYLVVLHLNPRDVRGHVQLGKVLSRQGKSVAAEGYFREALQREPSSDEACSGLATALAQQGKSEESLRYYQESLRLRPDQPDSLNNLAWMRATHPDPRFRDGAQAVAAAERAVKLSRSEVHTVDTLAAAYAERGRFSEALATARKALDLATQQHDQPLADEVRGRIRLFEAGKPYVDNLRRWSLPLPASPGKDVNAPQAP